MVVVPTPSPDDDGGPVAGWLKEHFGVDLAAAAQQLDLTTRPGSVAAIPLAGFVGGQAGPAGGSAPLLLVAGHGDGSPTQARRAGAVVGGRVRERSKVLLAGLSGLDDDACRAFLLGHALGRWQPRRTGRKATEPVVQQVLLAGVTDEAVPAQALRHADATLLTRDLATMPSNIKNPGWMAQQAIDLAAVVPGLKVTVKDADTLAAEGFGGLMAVGSGSASPPCLITVEYRPRRAQRHVVLVGKGITFDTGGISIKPREAMVTMKTDMAGSAAVLAAVAGVARAGLPVRVTAVMAMAENHFGASSYRPGDVVTVWSGRTVEVANTDAEGRMVLADALAWAADTLRPDVLVDVATLTGAASLGLGRGHAALYTHDDALAGDLSRAGEATGERVWRMPLVADYRSATESDIADLRHVPEVSPGGAGSITAALFLEPFAGDVPWAHLDIAGTGRAEKPSFEIAKGPTGYGARLLLEWLGA